METKKFISAIITNVISPKVIALMLLFNLPFLSFGQQEETKSISFENEHSEEYVLTSFVGKYVEGKIYIMWTVLEPSDECFYRLERSADGKTYNTVYTIKGGKSPANKELLNSFIDKEPLKGTSYYRVKRFAKGESGVSSTLIVNEPEIQIDLQFYAELKLSSLIIVN